MFIVDLSSGLIVLVTTNNDTAIIEGKYFLSIIRNIMTTNASPAAIYTYGAKANTTIEKRIEIIISFLEMLINQLLLFYYLL